MAEKKNVHPSGVQKKEKPERSPPNQSNTITSSPGSMSEGNLSNNKFEGTRRRVPHQKTFITGTDDDGQAV